MSINGMVDESLIDETSPLLQQPEAPPSVVTDTDTNKEEEEWEEEEGLEELEDSPPLTATFRLKCSTITAVGYPVTKRHPHVQRLTILRSPRDEKVMRWLDALPLWVSMCVAAVFPAFMMPDTLIVKKMKAKQDRQFQNEVNMYNRLKALQGDLIPRCWGETRVDGERAIVLSEIRGGKILTGQGWPQIHVDELQHMIELAWLQLATYSVVYNDFDLSNFIVMPYGSIVLIDLEWAEIVDSMTEIKYLIWKHLHTLRARYMRLVNAENLCQRRRKPRVPR